MRSLATFSNRIKAEGYTEDFTISEQGLELPSKQKKYSPEQIQIVTFFRFGDISDPDGNAALYVIETTEGTKGILIDVKGIYHNAHIKHFMKEVEQIKRKVVKN